MDEGDQGKKRGRSGGRGHRSTQTDLKKKNRDAAKKKREDLGQWVDIGWEAHGGGQHSSVNGYTAPVGYRTLM